MKIYKQYICSDCGYCFRHIPLLSNLIMYATVLADPALSVFSLFRTPVCPKCSSKNLRNK